MFLSIYAFVLADLCFNVASVLIFFLFICLFIYLVPPRQLMANKVCVYFHSVFRECCEVVFTRFSFFTLVFLMNVGCLLRSLPADVIFDNATGFSFTCDLSDNIAAPWPSSSSLSTLSLCAPGENCSKPNFCKISFITCGLLWQE